MRTIRFLCLSLVLVAASLGGEPSAAASKHAAGKPSVSAAEPPAFWIWFDNAGWHLRGSVGAKGKHTFVGYLRARGGIAGVKPSRSGVLRKQELDSEGIRFEFELAGGEKAGLVEGFDWQQSGDECVTAELKIDGKQQPARVFVGLRSESPEMFPFLSCRD